MSGCETQFTPLAVCFTDPVTGQPRPAIQHVGYGAERPDGVPYITEKDGKTPITEDSASNPIDWTDPASWSAITPGPCPETGLCVRVPQAIEAVCEDATASTILSANGQRWAWEEQPDGTYGPTATVYGNAAPMPDGTYPVTFTDNGDPDLATSPLVGTADMTISGGEWQPAYDTDSLAGTQSMRASWQGQEISAGDFVEYTNFDWSPADALVAPGNFAAIEYFIFDLSLIDNVPIRFTVDQDGGTAAAWVYHTADNAGVVVTDEGNGTWLLTPTTGSSTNNSFLRLRVDDIDRLNSIRYELAGDSPGVDPTNRVAFQFSYRLREMICNDPGGLPTAIPAGLWKRTTVDGVETVFHDGVKADPAVFDHLMASGVEGEHYTIVDCDCDGVATNDLLTEIRDALTGAPEPCVPGSAEHPLTALGMAHNVPDGVHHFDLGGVAFSALVESGEVLALRDFGDSTGAIPAGDTVGGRTILPPAALAALVDMDSLRIRHSDGLLDAATSDATLISRFQSGVVLNTGDVDNALMATWTGTGAATYLHQASNCSTTSSTALLAERIFHPCGDGSKMHWMPVAGIQQFSFTGPVDLPDAESFSFWVSAPPVSTATVCPAATATTVGCCSQKVDQACFSNGTETISVSGWMSLVDGVEVWDLVRVIASDDAAVTHDSILTSIPAGYLPITCQYNTTSEAPALKTSKCFVHTFVADGDEPFLNSAAAVTGKGNLTSRDWPAAQFANEGDAGGGIDAGYHSAVNAGPDGLPAVDFGQVTVTDATTAAVNENTAGGRLRTWEGYVYRPVWWNGQLVDSFELYDANTATTQSDRDEIWLGVDGTNPSLDRTDLLKVAEGQAGTTFELPDSWAGQSARLALVHSDAGGSSQVSWRTRITLADGTIVNNVALTNFVWNETTTPTQTGTDQEMITSVYDPITGLTTWTYANGDPADYANLQQPIQEVDCGYLPIEYLVTAIGDTVAIDAPALGDGAPYEYSFDGGSTFSSSPVLTLGDSSDGTERDIHSVRPMVRDSSGITSAIVSPSVVVTDPADQAGAALRVTDTPGGANNNGLATLSVDPALSGGWETDYGRQVLDNAPAGSMVYDGPEIEAVGANIIVRYDDAVIGGVSEKFCIPGSATTVGEPAVMRFNAYNYYYPWNNIAAGTDITLTVVDSAGAALGPAKTITGIGGGGDYEWNAGQQPEIEIPYAPDGNDVCLMVVDNSVGTVTNRANLNWQIRNLDIFEGAVVDASHHFYRVNGYIEARGINRPQNDPTCLVKAVDDVSESDLIRLTGSFTRLGTWDASGWAVEYQLDGGAWQTAWAHGPGLWDSAGEVATSPFTTIPIDVSGADDIAMRVCVWGDGDATDYLRLTALGFEEVSA